MLQFQRRDPSALASIQLLLLRVFHGAEQTAVAGDGLQPAAPMAPAYVLRQLAGVTELRDVVTAWFASRGGPAVPWSRSAEDDFRRWIAALPTATNLSPDEADRWCWAAYQNGRWDDAAALAARAPADAPAAEWVRAMLLLRQGFVDDAARHLARASRAFATDPALGSTITAADAGGWGRAELQPFGDTPSAQLAGVRGVLALRREHFAEALRIFRDAGHATDAAYVAERVLTLDELIAFARAEAPPPSDSQPGHSATLDVRHLLARRLVRAGRFADATEFFPPRLQPVYAAYRADMIFAFDAEHDAVDRGRALWRAAAALHDHGMDLVGTELEPDYHLWDGGFETLELAKWRGVTARRAEGACPDEEDHGLMPRPAPWQALPAEAARVLAAKVPSRRFHYRYRAAELAWLAASLLPNDDPLTARVLNSAGQWIAARAPDDANRFYRALVLRCPHTELGQRAAMTHWLVSSPGS